MDDDTQAHQRSRKRVFIVAIVIIQLSLIGLLLLKITHGSTVASVSPIELDSIVRSSKKLTYFTEPMPAQAQSHIIPSWGADTSVTYEHNQ